MSSEATEREVPEIEYLTKPMQLDFTIEALHAALRHYRREQHWLLRYFVDEHRYPVIMPGPRFIRGEFCVVSCLTTGSQTHMLLSVDGLGPSDFDAPERFGGGYRTFALANVDRKSRVGRSIGWTNAAIIVVYDHKAIPEEKRDWTEQYLDNKEEMIAWHELLAA